MLEFYYGWRRKAGCVLLVMALAVTGMFARSIFVQDLVTSQPFDELYVIFSSNGVVKSWCLSSRPNNKHWLNLTSELILNDPETLLERTFPRYDRKGDSLWGAVYWVIVLALTLLSTLLFLFPNKHKAAKPPKDSTVPESNFSP